MKLAPMTMPGVPKAARVPRQADEWMGPATSPRAASGTGSVSLRGHSGEGLGEFGGGHQTAAALEAGHGIGPEIVDRILVRDLNDPPQRPQQVAHCFVEDHAGACSG